MCVHFIFQMHTSNAHLQGSCNVDVFHFQFRVTQSGWLLRRSERKSCAVRSTGLWKWKGVQLKAWRCLHLECWKPHVVISSCLGPPALTSCCTLGHCAIILRLVWNAMNLINDKANVCAFHFSNAHFKCTLARILQCRRVSFPISCDAVWLATSKIRAKKLCCPLNWAVEMERSANIINVNHITCSVQPNLQLQIDLAS